MLKAVLQSICLSAILNVLYFFGKLAFGYVQTVLYQPDIMEAQNMHALDSSVAFGYTGNFLSTFSIRIGFGALLIFVLLKILARRRTIK